MKKASEIEKDEHTKGKSTNQMAIGGEKSLDQTLLGLNKPDGVVQGTAAQKLKEEEKKARTGTVLRRNRRSQNHLPSFFFPPKCGRDC